MNSFNGFGGYNGFNSFRGGGFDNANLYNSNPFNSRFRGGFYPVYSETFRGGFRPYQFDYTAPYWNGQVILRDELNPPAASFVGGLHYWLLNI